MKNWLRIGLLITAVTLYAAFGWIAGLVVLGVALVVFARRMVRARLALAPTITCPWCGETVEQYGAFSCEHCHARTPGWAWRCSVCGGWAGHVECPSCSMSITNPLLRGAS